jgi:hypothetical protein
MELAHGKPKVNAKKIAGELFLSLVIVAIVGAVLYPAQTQDRRKDRPIMCLSQLKQLGTAIQMYEADHDGGLPIRFTFNGPKETDEFIDATQPYLRNYQTIICPADFDAWNAASSPQSHSEEKHLMSYVHCTSLKGLIPEYDQGNRFFCPSNSDIDLAKSAYMREPIVSFGNPEGDQPGPAYLSLHRKYPIVSFLDGHVSGKTPLGLGTQF